MVARKDAATPPAAVRKTRRAVFVDRDGTINVEKGYVHRPEDFELIPGAGEALRLLQEAGFLIVVVTNQSGVARGFYTLETVHSLHRHMDRVLAPFGVTIDGYYVCPHHPEGETGDYCKICSCRKPSPGLLVQAADELSVDLARSYMIGDKKSDVEAGIKAGCRSLFVGTGHGDREVDDIPSEVRRFPTLLAAARAILAGTDASLPEERG